MTTQRNVYLIIVDLTFEICALAKFKEDVLLSHNFMILLQQANKLVHPTISIIMIFKLSYQFKPVYPLQVALVWATATLWPVLTGVYAIQNPFQVELKLSVAHYSGSDSNCRVLLRP